MPIELNTLRVFCRVAELASFTKAAEQLNIAKGRVSTIVQLLEAEVGSRLLQRTTRSVRLTADGEIFLQRSKELLAESDQLQGMFRPISGNLRGNVRIDMPSLFAQEIVMPELPKLLSAYPQLNIGISTNDRRVDMVQEGFDCLIRIGPLPDSDLVARPIGMMAICNLASPAYLEHYGVPLEISDLANHRVVYYSSNLRNEDASFRYALGGDVLTARVNSALSVNSSVLMQNACLKGLGIIQASFSTNKRLIESGELVTLLPQYTAPPVQVTLLYPHRRHIAPRVEAVFNWITSISRPCML